MVEHGAERFAEAAALLPYEFRQAALGIQDTEKARIEEFRLRLGRPLMVSSVDGEYPLHGCETLLKTADLGTVLEIASQASAHTVLDRVKNGFVTVRGGHRVGICGSAVVKDGEIYNLRQISSMAIRIAKEVPDAAGGVLPSLTENGILQSTLILSPPGLGKTTLLRDLIRRVSDGIGILPRRVGVADERGELAAMYDGLPQVDIGARTDVVDGCAKSAALTMLLRGMNPQVLAADEITAAADVRGMEEAAGCGVTLLCTAHGGSASDLWTRPLYRRLMEAELFQKVVLIRLIGGRRHYQVLNVKEETRC
ncbi:MAG: stage III sporulation protein AB [Clostridia bacterium]|nr:stage III sporulation protein AB [Clostridia bacterium]